METRELKIQVPEGFEIDKNKSTFEKIIFVKKDQKPRSWEEYLSKHNCKSENPFLNLPNDDLAKAFLAMMQLMSLRKDWIGYWKPDWTTDIDKKWCIAVRNCGLSVELFTFTAIPLSFPTEEMATDFMDSFNDLLEIAKPLI